MDRILRTCGIETRFVQLCLERYERIREKSGQSLCGLAGDRGFATQKTHGMLETDGVFDGLRPKDPKKLAGRIEGDEIFAAAMKRRAQTEGRIGILKKVFFEGTPRAKGLQNRRTRVAWAVLAHNLWVVARLPWAEDALRLAEAARQASHLKNSDPSSTV